MPIGSTSLRFQPGAPCDAWGIAGRAGNMSIAGVPPDGRLTEERQVSA